ncbi:MAG: lipid A biosynthesis (KDO)2-(lauroyl)-lipid IVA acyltransferase [Succinivibrio sp.]|nr:lipid A biosynthesis (KDO)2-(lauroyl)-lipid IVA acyltransferase [Succinivibrio sp.]
MTDPKFDISFHREYLHPRYIPSWLGIGILGILAFIPAIVRDFVADILSGPVSKLNISFKKRVFNNFTYAFPDYDEMQKEKLYRDFVRIGLKVILGYGEMFFRSRSHIRKTYMITGKEYLDEALAQNRPVVFLGSHSWAVDRGGIMLAALGLTVCSLMHTSKNKVYDWFMNRMRLKFGGKIYERSAGIKAVIRALREGFHVSFYPDEDLGPKSAVFVKFFASPKASLVVVPKLAEHGNALVVPMFSAYNEEHHKFEIIFDRYFDNYPSKDIKADVRRMNEAIENALKGREGQYMWFLKYYVTRPEAEEDPN